MSEGRRKFCFPRSHRPSQVSKATRKADTCTSSLEHVGVLSISVSFRLCLDVCRGVAIRVFLVYLFIGEWKKTFSFFLFASFGTPDGWAVIEGEEMVSRRWMVYNFFCVPVRWIEKKIQVRCECRNRVRTVRGEYDTSREAKTDFCSFGEIRLSGRFASLSSSLYNPIPRRAGDAQTVS